MSGAHVVAFGAVSSLGTGKDAFYVGDLGAPPRVAIARDADLENAGLQRPFCARAALRSEASSDRASVLLRFALRQCLSELDPAWLGKRIGLAIGTSSGAMLSAERFFAARAAGAPIGRDLARSATYFAPLDDVTDSLGVSFAPRVLLLGACASSTLALGLAIRWLQLGRCDCVLSGGFDAVSTFVASGFEALRATTASLPRPFRLGRDGMVLGEGAAVVALAREPTAERSFGYVAGFGASTDAVHLTAPDASGQGLARAAKAAIADASVRASEVDLVSAHATATPFNDPAETKAIRSAVGDAPSVVHPFKAQIGHTLGAAGALETLAALDALARRVGPGAAGEGEQDPECRVPLYDVQRELHARVALKLSSAFGGANAALVLTPRTLQSSPHRAPRTVFLRAFATVTAALDSTALSQALSGRHPHLHRLDALARLVITAVHRLAQAAPIPAGAGVIVGHALATLETNDQFDARRRTHGARAVEPRRFPATSPNAVAGECAIAFRLKGPSFGVGASLHGGLEALAVARDMVAVRDADAMVVVAPDLAGEASSALLAAAGAAPLAEGACACLLTSEPGPGAITLEGTVPVTLADAADWKWAAPFGHRELAAHLGRLGR